MWGFGDGDRAGSDGCTGVCRCCGFDRAFGGGFGGPVCCRVGCGIGGGECGTQRDAARRDARDVGGTIVGGFAEQGGFADGGDAGYDRGRADAEVAGDGAG
jgi:hypothetical protein